MKLSRNREWVANMEYTPVKTQINYSKLENSEIDFYGVKKRRIFHYTSIRGLEGILGHRKLHFTNIKYMNDKDEIIAGVESMAKISKDSEKMTEMLRSAVINPGTQTFVCCFSLDEDSLPMWNYYTKEINNQGYNIEFDDRKLAESILRNNSALDGCDLSFGMVYYSKNNDSAFSKIIVDEILTALNLSVSKLFSTVSQGMLSDKIPHIDESLLKDWEKR